MIVFIKFGYSWNNLLFWVLFSLLLVVAMIDLYHRIIPDGVLIAGTIIGLPLAGLQSIASLVNGVIGFIAAGGLIMLLIAVVSKGGMGGGDIKLSAVMGQYPGRQGVLAALLIAFPGGGLFGLFLLLTGRRGRKDAVPFGPFLAPGGAAAVLWGGELLAWYMAVVGMVYYKS